MSRMTWIWCAAKRLHLAVERSDIGAVPRVRQRAVGPRPVGAVGSRFAQAIGSRTVVEPVPRDGVDLVRGVSSFHPLLQVPGTLVPCGFELSMPVTLSPVSCTA